MRRQLPKETAISFKPASASDRAVTLTDVAALAKVSLQTVSNAINAPQKLAPDTLARTRAAIDTLGYKPNRAARSLRNHRSRLIAVKVEATRPDRAVPLLDQFLHALSASAAELDYHLILCQASNDAEEIAAYDELLRTTWVDALVLYGTHRRDPRVPWLSEQGVTIATFGRSWDDNPSAIWVDVDGRKGIRAVTDHLVKLGHGRIAHIGWPLDSDVGHDRREGWREGCETHGLATRHLDLAVPDSIEAGVEATGKLLALKRPPTAIVCASDTLAFGAMRALARAGLRPGEDVAVTGFDDSPSASMTTPTLTTVRQPLSHVAYELITRIDAELSGRQLSPRHTLLDPSLVVRETTLLHQHTSQGVLT